MKLAQNGVFQLVVGNGGSACLLRQPGSLGEGTLGEQRYPGSRLTLISVSGPQQLANCPLIPRSQETLATRALLPAASRPPCLLTETADISLQADKPSSSSP